MLDSQNPGDNFNSVDSTTLAWYTVRIISHTEDKIVTLFRERIEQFNLQEQIVDIQVLKEYAVNETPAYPPNSEYLPQRGFRKGKNYVWVKTTTGHYKKISVAEKKSFKSLIFLKMVYDLELFKRIKSWEFGIYFLGDPNPQAMSDSAFEKMRSSINTEVPSIEEHIKANDYVIVEGTLKKIEKVQPIVSKKPVEEMPVSDEAEQKPSQSKMSETFMAPPEEKKHFKPIDPKKLKAHDLVFLNELGVQAEIQYIDHENSEVVLSIQVFGRRQSVCCKFDQISEI